MNPIVRNIQTSVPYEYLGDFKFRNLHTGVEGVVEEDKANKIFKLNLEASQIIHDYPIVKELILKLKLKLDVTT